MVCADLAQMIYDLHLRFVRFPGGCGRSRFDRDGTIGNSPSARWNSARSGGAWNYRRTVGMGLFEYFQFCEDLRPRRFTSVSPGRRASSANASMPMEDMGWVRDNFLDVIEYANGAADSKFGALRVQIGHKVRSTSNSSRLVTKPSPEFQQRYEFIHSALKAKHPDPTYFADLSWTSRESMRDSVRHRRPALPTRRAGSRRALRNTTSARANCRHSISVKSR